MLRIVVGDLSWTTGTAIVTGIGALILLVSLPLAQYVVLRDHVRRAVLWIPINMAAWVVGITWTLLPSPWIDESTPVATLILIYGIAGLCIAATVAVITGSGMIRLLRPIGTARSASPGGSSQVVEAESLEPVSYTPARKVSSHECRDCPRAAHQYQLSLPPKHRSH
jgi:hypothetical protein